MLATRNTQLLKKTLVASNQATPLTARYKSHLHKKSISVSAESTGPYPSYSYIQQENPPQNYQPFKKHDISPQTHQAVVNEIDARASNYGGILRSALPKAIEFISAQINSNGWLMSAICGPEDKDPDDFWLDTAPKIENCVKSTVNLAQSLSAVKKAEDSHLRCLKEKGVSSADARLIQWRQRPRALQTHTSLFFGAKAGPYKPRMEENGICKSEALNAINANNDAESAEQQQYKACDFTKSEWYNYCRA